MGFGRGTSAISVGVLALVIGGGIWLPAPAHAAEPGRGCEGDGLLSGVTAGLCRVVDGLADAVGGVGEVLTGGTRSRAERGEAGEDATGDTTGDAAGGGDAGGEPGDRSTPSAGLSARASAGAGEEARGRADRPGDADSGPRYDGRPDDAGADDGARDGGDGSCAGTGSCARDDRREGAGDPARDRGEGDPEARATRSPGRGAGKEGRDGSGAGARHPYRGTGGADAAATGAGEAAAHGRDGTAEGTGDRRDPEPSPTPRPHRADLDKAELPLLLPGPTLPAIKQRTSGEQHVKPRKPDDDVVGTVLTAVLLLSAVLAARVVSTRNARQERRQTIPLEPGHARGRRHRLA